MYTKTLFENIGGDATLEAAIEDFYCHVVVDPILSPFFEGINMGRLKNHQRRFFEMAFTRIPAIIDVSKVLIEKHAHLFDDSLNEKHFDKVFRHFVDTLHTSRNDCQRKRYCWSSSFCVYRRRQALSAITSAVTVHH